MAASSEDTIRVIKLAYDEYERGHIQYDDLMITVRILIDGYFEGQQS